MARGDCAEGVHVGGNAEGVDDENGAGARGDGGSTAAGSRLSVTGSMSAKTGVARTWRTALATAMKVKEGTMTSSPSADAEGEEGKMKAGGAGADGYGVGDAVVRGESGFEGQRVRGRG